MRQFEKMASDLQKQLSEAGKGAASSSDIKGAEDRNKALVAENAEITNQLKIAQDLLGSFQQEAVRAARRSRFYIPFFTRSLCRRKRRAA